MDQLPADEAAALAFEHAAYSLAAQASERAARNTSQLTFRSSEREEMEMERERGSEAVAEVE
jgi:hypothetical protein